MYNQRILHNNMNVHTIQHIGTIQFFITKRNNLIQPLLSQDNIANFNFNWKVQYLCRHDTVLM
jgi:hypothetical protein